jgi:hypothetical protein
MAVTRKGTRIALDNEVVPFVTEKGESTFTLTEEAIKIGDLKFEWQRGRYHNAKLHEFLGHWIYQDQTAHRSSETGTVQRLRGPSLRFMSCPASPLLRDG